MVTGVMCVFVAHFRSPGTFESLSTVLTVNIHMSTKTCVTGNNFILHKAPVLNVMPCTDRVEQVSALLRPPDSLPPAPYLPGDTKRGQPQDDPGQEGQRRCLGEFPCGNKVPLQPRATNGHQV